MAEEFGDAKGVEAAGKRWTRTALSWVRKRKRDPDVEKDNDLQPKTKRRCSFQVGLCADSVLKKFCGAGLSRFLVDKDPLKRAPVWEWPFVSFAMDQGSDNVCLSMFLRNGALLNCDFFWDISHGVWRDVDLTVGAVSLKPFVRLATIGLNLVFGPWEDGSRYWQMVQGMEELFTISDGRSDPLFLSMLPQLMRDLDIEDRIGEEHIEQTVWDMLKQMWMERKKGERVALCRFAKFTDVAEAKDKQFHFLLLQALYVGLQEGMFSAESFAEVMASAKGGAGAEDADKRSAVRRGNDAVNRLRGACKNNLHTTAIIFSDPLTQPRLRTMCRFTQCIRKWYGLQSKGLRSCQNSATWLSCQVAGEVWAPLCETIQMLSSPEDLEFCGLSIDGFQEP